MELKDCHQLHEMFYFAAENHADYTNNSDNKEDYWRYWDMITYTGNNTILSKLSEIVRKNHNDYALKTNMRSGEKADFLYHAILKRVVDNIGDNGGASVSKQTSRYVVYLVDHFDKKVYLTFNQGTKKRKLEDIEKTSEELRDNLKPYFNDPSITWESLPGVEYSKNKKYGKGYSEGTVCYISYDLNTLSQMQNDDKLIEDLEKFIKISDKYFEPKEKEQMSTNKTDNSEEFSICKIIEKEISSGIKQIVLTGAPGTGKTYNAKEYVKKYISKKKDYWKDNYQTTDNYGFVQFHSSYNYTDFMEGLRPVVIDDKVTFVKMDGVFKEFCRKVVEHGNDKNNYFFIIDEINRADLSKVFGELMFGLEDSYRGEKFKTQYINLPTYEWKEKEAVKIEIENDIFADGFYVPKNLIIIATMNNIDRSVETFDFALRRRFRWIDIKANKVMESALKAIFTSDGTQKLLTLDDTQLEDLKNSAVSLNKTISAEGKQFGLNEDYHIGPAYYKHYTKAKNKEEYFENYLEPILREYVRGRKEDNVKKFIENCKTSFIDPSSKDNKNG